MDSRALDVFHNSGNYKILAVANRVNLDFRSHHILINKHGVFEFCRRDDVHIFDNIAVTVRDYHILSAENV